MKHIEKELIEFCTHQIEALTPPPFSLSRAISKAGKWLGRTLRELSPFERTSPLGQKMKALWQDHLALLQDSYTALPEYRKNGVHYNLCQELQSRDIDLLESSTLSNLIVTLIASKLPSLASPQNTLNTLFDAYVDTLSSYQTPRRIQASLQELLTPFSLTLPPLDPYCSEHTIKASLKNTLSQIPEKELHSLSQSTQRELKKAWLHPRGCHHLLGQNPTLFPLMTEACREYIQKNQGIPLGALSLMKQGENQGYSKSGHLALTRTLSQSENLKYLDLKGLHWTDTTVRNLCQTFKKSPDLQELRMGKGTLTPSQASPLFQALSQFKKLKKLEIPQLSIGASFPFHHLKQLHQLHTLSLTHLSLEPLSFQSALEILPNLSLCHLNLSHTPFSDATLLALIPILQQLPQLKTLELRHCQLSQDSLIELNSWLNQSPSPISLHIQGNTLSESLKRKLERDNERRNENASYSQARVMLFH